MIGIFRRIQSATYDQVEEIMTVRYSNGQEEQYLGAETVWHKLPMMKRCGIFKESELCEIYKYIKFHGNPYPTAHMV